MPAATFKELAKSETKNRRQTPKVRVQAYFTAPDFNRMKMLCQPMAVSRYVSECALRITAAAEARSRKSAE